jgi:hypothetical protein
MPGRIPGEILGGTSPYVSDKVPDGLSHWHMLDRMLDKCQVECKKQCYAAKCVR